MVDGITPTWAALLPPVVALGFSFLTRQVVLALFGGVVTGAIVLFTYTGSFSDASLIENFFVPALATKTFVLILLIYLWSLGGILGTWRKTGGAQYFAELLSQKVARTRRSTMVLTWILGCTFHQGGTISTVLTSTTVRPISDKQKVSHEELAYIVDSTASPVATVLPFNAWPIYVAGIIAGTVPIIPDTFSGYRFFMSSIPFNFYALITLSFTFLFAMGWLPWVGSRMRAAIDRVRATGELNHPDASPLIKEYNGHKFVARGYEANIFDFLVPITIMIGMIVTPFLLWKLGYIGEENANWVAAAFMTACISSMFLAYMRGMSIGDIIDGFIDGSQSMLLGVLIIALAMTLGVVTQKVGTAEYLIMLTEGMLNIYIMPALLTVLCMIVAFSTGSAFGTYAVVYPVALPLAWSMHPDPFFIQVCFGAVLGGTLFGDQCSPISDTTILTSMFTGCDLLDHVRTQMPLALVSATLGILMSTLMIFIN